MRKKKMNDCTRRPIFVRNKDGNTILGRNGVTKKFMKKTEFIQTISDKVEKR